eukprot:TRINITY_DN780_c0_g3_i1.p1 TRINITY_DN780_c0_g3~~TRINITY_DN780_c0_g3_i1.p1  ORF type:complete len:3107 (-),score=538.58 TRINITY_DN780_c0_g3_i1:112-9432(-)
MKTSSTGQYFVSPTHTCMIESGAISCWGRSSNQMALGIVAAGYVGDNGGEMAGVTPLTFATSHEAVDMDVDSAASCAVFNNGKARCWGKNYPYGRLATDDSNLVTGTANTVPFIPQSNAYLISQISIGLHGGCTLHVNGRIRCWGEQGIPGIDSTETIGDQANEMTASAYIVFSDSHPAVSVHVGNMMACAVFETAPYYNQVRCWGYNVQGQIMATGGREYVGRTSGDMSTLGYMDFGTTYDVLQISLDQAYHGHCALFNTTDPAAKSRIRCWGDNTWGVAGPSPLPILSTASALQWLDFGDNDYAIKLSKKGYYGFCAVFENGGSPSGKCWGDNSYMQTTGDNLYRVTGNYGLSNRPIKDSPFPNFKVVSLNSGVANMGLLSIGGSFVGWGRNFYDQLSAGYGQDYGNNLNVMYLSSAAAWLSADHLRSDNGASITQVEVTGDRTCFLLSNGDVKCLGHNGPYLNLGYPHPNPGNVQVGILDNIPALEFLDNTGVISLSCGDSSNGPGSCCVVFVSGGVVCWGGNANWGQLGLDNAITESTGGSHLPTRQNIVFSTTHPAIDVSVGGFSTCVIFSVSGSTKMRCFGAGFTGMLGLDSLDNWGTGAGGSMMSNLPFVGFAADGATVRQVSNEYGTSCAVFSNGGVRCWGENSEGQLGLDTTNVWGSGAGGSLMVNLPYVSFATTHKAVKVAAAESHVCALFNNLRARCWGKGGTGALGQGTSTDAGSGSGIAMNALPFITFADANTIASDVLSSASLTTPVTSIEPSSGPAGIVTAVTIRSTDGLVMPGDYIAFAPIATACSAASPYIRIKGNDNYAEAMPYAFTAGSKKVCYLKGGSTTPVEQTGITVVFGPPINVTTSSTINNNINETDLVLTAGLTLQLEVTGDTWAAGVTTGNSLVNTLYAGFSGTFDSLTTGFKQKVVPLLNPTMLTRDSATVVTITFPAAPGYAIPANEAISVTVASTLLAGGVASGTTTKVIIADDFALSIDPPFTLESQMVAGFDMSFILRGATWPSTLTTGSADAATFVTGLFTGTSNNLVDVHPVPTAAGVTRVDDYTVRLSIPPVPKYILLSGNEQAIAVVKPAVVDNAPSDANKLKVSFSIVDQPSSNIVNATYPGSPLLMDNPGFVNFTLTATYGGMTRVDRFILLNDQVTNIVGCGTADALSPYDVVSQGTVALHVPLAVPTDPGVYSLCMKPKYAVDNTIVALGAKQDAVSFEVYPQNHTDPHFTLLTVPDLSITSLPINLWDWMTIHRPNPWPVDSIVFSFTNAAAYDTTPTTNITVGTATDPINVGLYFDPTSAGAAQSTVSVYIKYQNGLKSATVSQTINILGLPLPTLVSIVPHFGPVKGNTVVTLSGSSFGLTSAHLKNIYIGGQECGSRVFVSQTTATCSLPAWIPATPRIVDANITTFEGTGVLKKALEYKDAPTVTLVSPRYATVGTPVTITLEGTDFATEAKYLTSVTFGGQSCPSPVWLSAGKLTCTHTFTAPGSKGAPVVISATSGDSRDDVTAHAAAPVFFVAAQPVVTSVTPPSGPASNHTLIRIQGKDFGWNEADTPKDEISVKIGDIECTDVVRVSDTVVTCKTGLSATVAVLPVVVTTLYGGSSSSEASAGVNTYQYTPGVPAITSFLPRTSLTYKNSSVTITGVSFSDPMKGEISGYLCGGNGRVDVLSSTVAVCVLASPDVARIGKITLETEAGKGSSDSYYIVRARTLIQPAVLDVFPARGPLTGGTVTEILGEFLGASAGELRNVRFGNVTVRAQDRLWLSSSKLTVITPMGPDLGLAPVHVETSFGGDSVSRGFFEFLYPNPIGAGGFPRQGLATRVNTITLVGEYFGRNSSSVLTITVAGAPCGNIQRSSSTAVACDIPMLSTADDPVFIVIADGLESLPFKTGFKYVPESEICEPSCSFRADCVAKQCVCQSGWTGPTCEDPIFKIEPERLETSEDGLSSRLTVTLLQTPTSPVTITLKSSDVTEASVDPSVLVIEATTPNLQAVSVITGIPDELRDGSIPYNITFAPFQSIDFAFNDATSAPLEMINLDSAPVIMHIIPPISPLNGTNVTIYGYNFDQELQLKIGSTLVPLTDRYEADLSKVDTDKYTIPSFEGRSRLRLLDDVSVYNTGGSSDVLSVTDPRFSGLQTTTPPSDRKVFALTFFTGRQPREIYRDVYITNSGGTSSRVEDGLFFTDNCPEPGSYGRGSDCQPCPDCGFCPGGYRVWPKEGCWGGTSLNNGEKASVFRCPVPESCVGGPRSLCDVGYRGDFCSQCTSGYYKQGDICVKCPEASSAWIFVVCDVVVWGLIAAACLAIEDRESLSHVIALIISLQSVAGVGQLVAGNLASWMREIYSVFHLISGDIQFLKPDCQGDINFELEFYIRLAYNLAIGILLIAGLPVVRWVSRRIHQRRWGTKRAALIRDAHFKNRAYRIVTIWLFLMYLTVTTSCVSIIACYPVDGEWRNIAQPSHICFKSQAHISATIVSVFILVVYTFGFPFFMFRSQQRARIEGYLRLYHFAERFDLLYEPFTSSYQFFWFGEIILSIVFALSESVLSLWPYVEYLVPAAVLLVLFILIYAVRPFHRPWEGWVISAIYVSNIIGLILIMLIEEDKIDATGAKIMAYILAAIVVGSAIIFLGVVLYYIIVVQTGASKYHMDQLDKADDGDMEALMELEYGSLMDDDLTSVDAKVTENEDAGALSAAFANLTSLVGGGADDASDNPFSVVDDADALGPEIHSETVVAEKVTMSHVPLKVRMRVEVEKKPVLLPRPDTGVLATFASVFNNQSKEPVPEYWPMRQQQQWSLPWGESDIGTSSLTPLDPESDIYKKIESIVQRTFRSDLVGGGADNPNLFHEGIRVTKIAISEHASRWRTYVAQKQLYRETYQKVIPQNIPVETDDLDEYFTSMLSKDVNEKFLFHGTSPHLVEVLHNTGFDERVSAPPNLFGNGIYFTEASSKADEYSKPVGGQCVIVLSRVLLGLPFQTKKPQTDLRRPPCIVGHSLEACSHPRFDSVVGEKGEDAILKKYREFIVYRHTTALPEFFIYYERYGGERRMPKHIEEAPDAEQLPSREDLMKWAIASIRQDGQALRGEAEPVSLPPLKPAPVLPSNNKGGGGDDDE